MPMDRVHKYRVGQEVIGHFNRRRGVIVELTWDHKIPEYTVDFQGEKCKTCRLRNNELHEVKS